MSVIIAHPTNPEKFEALKAFMNALKIKFEISDSEYSSEFLKMIKEGESDLKQGKGKKISSKDIDNLCK